MGVYSNLLAGARTINVADDALGSDRAIVNELKSLKELQQDIAAPDALANVDEAVTISAFVEDGTLSGTFDLTITLFGGGVISVVDIDFDATASEIETAIDEVSGLDAGAISVAGGPLDADDVTVVFDGAEVAGYQHTVAIDLANIVDNDGGGVVTEDVVGATFNAVAILAVSGVLTVDTPPASDDAGAYTANPAGPPHPNRPSDALTRALAREAGVTLNNPDVTAAILAALSL